MASLGQYVAGGLLSGIGAGVVETGKAAREQALREMEMRFRSGESEKDRSFRRGENQADRDFRSSEARTERDFKAIQTDKEFSFRTGEREAGQAYRTGEREATQMFNTGEREAGQQFRASESAAQRAQQRGLLSNTREVVDKEGRVWLEFADGRTKPVLDDSGRQIVKQTTDKSEPLEEIYDESSPTGTRLQPRSKAAGQPGGKNAEKNIEVRTERDRAEREDARRQAEAEAKDKAGYFSSDESDFKNDSGSRAAFIERRTNEILAGRRGGTSGVGDQKAAVKPTGQGTKSDPYKATTQADVDWFKANAPAGAIIEVQGKRYTK